jgi:NitT/TauT family transport system substrate-binding protein
LWIQACTCQPPVRLRLAVLPGVACELLALAAEQNIFAKHQIAIEIGRYPSLAEAQKAMHDERLDGLCASLSELLLLETRAEGQLKVILIPAYSNGADLVITRKDLGRGLVDLKGARIGLIPGSMGELLLLRAFAAHAVASDEFTILPLAAQELFDSIHNSAIQVAVVGPPLSMELVKNPELQVLFQSSQIAGEMLDTLSLTAPILRQHPALQGRVLQVWSDVLQFKAEHPKTALSLLTKQTAIPAAKITQNFVFLDRQQQEEYLQREGRLLPLIEVLQNQLLLSGSLKQKREPRHFLVDPTQPQFMLARSHQAWMATRKSIMKNDAASLDAGHAAFAKFRVFSDNSG